MEINCKEKVLIIAALKDSYENILNNKWMYEDYEEEAEEIHSIYRKLLYGKR